MSSKIILNKLYEIRDILIDYIVKNNVVFKSIDNNYSITLKNNFDIIELNNELDIYDECSIHGVTYIDTSEWISIKAGLKIANPETIKIIFLAVKFKNNDKYLPIESIIHTFIHELSHTVTIPEAHISKNIDKKTKQIQPTVLNKKKKSFMQNHHNNAFYSNFAKLLRICEILNIYILPKNYHNFSPKNLQRYDSMIYHYDLMSFGKSPKYSNM